MITHEDHIWELAEQHDIHVRWTRKRRHHRDYNGDWGGTAAGSVREISLHWQSEGDQAYWVALHEIGHIVLGHRGLPETPEGTAGEAEAWEWALDHARCVPSTDVYLRVCRALESYVRARGYHTKVAEVTARYCRAARS